MEPFLDVEIRQRLMRYVSGEISLKDFVEWFVPATWNVRKSGNQTAAVELTYKIELRLAEFSNGHWTESDMAKLLRSIAEHYTLCVGTSCPEQREFASSSSKTTRARFMDQPLVSGRRFAEASA